MKQENYLQEFQNIRGTTIAIAIESYIKDRVSDLSVQLRSVKPENPADVAYLQGQINGIEEIYMAIQSPNFNNQGEVDITNKNKIQYFFDTLFNRGGQE